MLSEDELDDLIADNNFQHGRDYERERIIALLKTTCKPNDHEYINGCNCDAIALIKGENE